MTEINTVDTNPFMLRNVIVRHHQ